MQRVASSSRASVETKPFRYAPTSGAARALVRLGEHGLERANGRVVHGERLAAADVVLVVQSREPRHPGTDSVRAPRRTREPNAGKKGVRSQRGSSRG